ncbi:MAG TPA: hypothetical protein VEH84_18410 [Alphaproteobacteria bacterium]|nr:hypothetical protein [Alphaproteobacteria bacterium]
MEHADRAAARIAGERPLTVSTEARRARLDRGVLAVLLVRLCRAVAAPPALCESFHAVVAEGMAGLTGGEREHLRRRLVREADAFEAAQGRAGERRFAATLRVLVAEVLRDGGLTPVAQDAFRRGADLLEELREESELGHDTAVAAELRAWLESRGLFGQGVPA